MNRTTPFPAFLIALALLTACGSSTRVVQSWKDPGVTVEDGSYNKVLVIALIKDEATRRTAEDHMARFMNGHGVTSYSYLGADQSQINEAGMSQQMQQDGIDGALIMRLADKTTEKTYVPPTTSMGYYGGAWGYYGYAYPMYTSPGYVQTDRYYYVETNLYSPKREGPLWTSTTSTMNPTDAGSAVDDIMDAIYRKMKQEGFVVGAAKH